LIGGQIEYTSGSGTATGVVDSVKLVNGSPVLVVGNTQVQLSDVTKISIDTSSSATEDFLTSYIQTLENYLAQLMSNSAPDNGEDTTDPTDPTDPTNTTDPTDTEPSDGQDTPPDDTGTEV
jgi:hypothetical protein